MPITMSAICDGVLPLVTTVLFTAVNKTLVKSIVLVNTTGGSLSVNVYVNRTGSNRHILPADLSLGIGCCFAMAKEALFVLEPGDTLLGDATGTGVDYVVSGATET